MKICVLQVGLVLALFLAYAGLGANTTTELPNCVAVGPFNFRWVLDGEWIEFEIQGAVDSTDTWFGVGFTEGSTVRMANSDVVIGGFVGFQPVISSYSLTMRSSSGVTESGPDVSLISASMMEGGMMRIRAKRPLGTWPTDGSQAVIWATGPLDGPAESPTVLYHGTSHAPGGTTGTIVLDTDQDTCDSI